MYADGFPTVHFDAGHICVTGHFTDRSLSSIPSVKFGPDSFKPLFLDLSHVKYLSFGSDSSVSQVLTTGAISLYRIFDN